MLLSICFVFIALGRLGILAEKSRVIYYVLTLRTAKTLRTHIITNFKIGIEAAHPMYWNRNNDGKNPSQQCSCIHLQQTHPISVVIKFQGKSLANVWPNRTWRSIRYNEEYILSGCIVFYDGAIIWFKTHWCIFQSVSIGTIFLCLCLLTVPYLRHNMRLSSMLMLLKWIDSIFER